MATRDIASDLKVVIAMNAAITTDTDTFGSAVDTANYDDGFMFFIDLAVYSTGDVTFTLQDRATTSASWVDVPANKLISQGTVTFTAATSPLDALGRIGAFSTDRYVRLKVTSSNTASYTVVGYCVEKGEIKPAV